MGDKRNDYLDNITFKPVDAGILLRSPKELLDKLLVDYALASIATYAFCSKHEVIKDLLVTMDDLFDISKVIQGKDKELIINIYNKKVSKDNLEEITYRFESANVIMWILGLSDELYFDKKCSVKKINEVLLKSENYHDILNKCKPREVSEILDYYNKIAKYIYSDSELEFISAKVISIQDNTFKYAILYNFSKSGIKVDYKKDSLHFEFILPEHILFNKVGDFTHELFALAGVNNDIRIIFSELTNIDVQDDLKKYDTLGFDILNVDYIRSVNIDKRMLKVKVSKAGLMLNVYYLNINDHIIKFTSKDTQVNVDSDIIFSIKVL